MQELRILAYLTKEDSWVNAIDEGRDLHRMVASMILSKPEDQITKEERGKAKAINFGLVYGISAFGLARGLEIGNDEAQELIDKFLSAFPKIDYYLKKCEERGERLQIAISPLDARRRSLKNMDWNDWRKKSHALNISKNQTIQGPAATITKLALVNLQNYIDVNNKKSMIIAVIHDEILVESPPEEAEEMQKVVSDKMVAAFYKYCPDVKMEADAVLADHWVH